MGNFLKNLLKNNTNSVEVINNNSTNQEKNLNSETEKATPIEMEEFGYEQAKKFKGDMIGLTINLQKLYYIFKRKYEKEQSELKAPYVEEKNQKEIEFSAIQASIDFLNEEKIPETERKIQNIKENKIPEVEQIAKGKIEKITQTDIPEQENKIDKLKDEKKYIIAHPEEFIGEKPSKFAFIIEIILLTFLTIYLFVFYSSASYSAFFKDFGKTIDEMATWNAIFDPQAVANAINAGITELIFILTIPFVFLGLGYLLHKFQEKKSYIKLLSVFVFAFLFDSLLAYEIVEKIYSIKKLNSFENMPEYTLNIAFQDINFWIIIFSGFMVYILWGFVFDYFINTYEKFDIVRVKIKEKNDEIKLIEEKILELNNKKEQINNNAEEEKQKEQEKIKILEDEKQNFVSELSSKKKDLKTIQSRIIQLNDILSKILVDIVETRQWFWDFFRGWARYMKECELSDVSINICQDTVVKFLEKIETENRL